MDCVTELRCVDCPEWCGRCRKGRLNRVARSVACQEFSNAVAKFSSELVMLPLFMKVKP